MVKNLMALINGATIGDLAGLEELIGMLVASKDIDKSCFQVGILAKSCGLFKY
jgi:hypothetical protein